MDIGSDSDSDLLPVCFTRSLNQRRFIDLMEQISKHIESGLNTLRETDPEFCDIELTVDSHTILAHKIVLAACSSYFYTMFSKSFRVKNRRKVVLEMVDDDIVKMLIDYMYTAQLPINSENCFRIYLMARKLQITVAEEVSIEYIIHDFTLDNCFEILRWAVLNFVEKVRDDVIKYIATHLNHFVTSDELQLTDFNEFRVILATNRVRKYPDDMLFSLIIRWGYADETRHKYLYDLLHNTIKCSSQVKKVLHKSRNLTKYVPIEILNAWIVENAEKVRLTMDRHWNIILCKRTGHFDCRLLRFSKPFNFGMQKLPKEYFDGCYFSYGGTAYHSGGCLARLPPTNETFCYNIYKNKWLPFIPLLRPRAYHCSLVVNGKIYTCGGSDGHSSFTSAESIDLITGKQIFLPDMLFPRESMGISSFNNAIYVMGGKDRGISQNRIIERFDPRVGIWNALQHHSFIDGINSVAIAGHNIYSTDGRGKSMQRFDFVGDKFIQINTENYKYPLSLFSYQNELYGVFDKHISQFESTNGTWINKELLPDPDIHVIAIPIEMYSNKEMVEVLI